MPSLMSPSAVQSSPRCVGAHSLSQIQSPPTHRSPSMVASESPTVPAKQSAVTVVPHRGVRSHVLVDDDTLERSEGTEDPHIILGRCFFRSLIVLHGFSLPSSKATASTKNNALEEQLVKPSSSNNLSARTAALPRDTPGSTSLSLLLRTHPLEVLIYLGRCFYRSAMPQVKSHANEELERLIEQGRVFFTQVRHASTGSFGKPTDEAFHRGVIVAATNGFQELTVSQQPRVFAPWAKQEAPTTDAPSVVGLVEEQQLTLRKRQRRFCRSRFCQESPWK